MRSPAARHVRLALAVACLAFAACARDAVVFGTSTRIGVEVDAAEGGQPGIHVGYKRAEGVIMPTRREDDKVISKAFSVLALHRLETGGLAPTQLGHLWIDQVFATGSAATAAAASGSVEAAFLAHFDPDASSRCLEAWLEKDEANRATLQNWIEKQQLGVSVTLFVFGDEPGGEQREKAISELGIDCSEEQ